MRRIPGLLLAASLVVTACTPSIARQPSASDLATAGEVAVRVAAAADLRFAMDELVAAWSSANPGITVAPTYGSSGTFVAQISEGAPFDAFFSADAGYPLELEAAGLTRPGSTRVYAIGQIVVWVPASSTLDVEQRGLNVMADPAVEKIAIANPEHAPYGRAAVAAMRSAGIYDRVEPKLVLGDNVSQAAQFVESGSADIGVIALSLAMAPAMRGLGRYAIVPIGTYPRLEQGAVVLGSAADPDAATAFVDFVLGPDGRAILDRYGFLVPQP